MVFRQELPDYLFEVSWEVCNKVGGIHTVLSTKSVCLKEKMEDRLIMIGPDVNSGGEDNTEFIEDYNILSGWKEVVKSKGLKIRVGRWNITSSPLAVLIDFTSLFSSKDKIFASLWEEFGLDSISGQWDYIEPTLFGYAAGQVIDSYCRFNLSGDEKVIAHFHEWMTGSGVLFLKNNSPFVGTAFTSHATVLGRSIAGNGQPLYGDLKKYNPASKAREFNVVAKHSLEKLSAENADCFSTVSNITAVECAWFLDKEVDLVTPNGFEDSFVPSQDIFDKRREEARERLFEVGEALLNHRFSDDTLLICTSGRYEFKNKGLDVYIDALGKLNQSGSLDKDVLAFVLVPAHNYGFDPVLRRKLDGEEVEFGGAGTYLTHGLHDAEYDSVYRKISEAGLGNGTEDRVKVIFVPVYLNGQDGIFNKTYFDLLIGFDMTVFPSYYEPWGYTPLESLAFHVPTVTTTLTGFGLWVQSASIDHDSALEVIPRDDGEEDDVAEQIEAAIRNISSRDGKTAEYMREKAFYISRIALWNNLIKYYYSAYGIVIDKLGKRKEESSVALGTGDTADVTIPAFDTHPIWMNAFVRSSVPQELNFLLQLSKNLWWSWNCRAVRLFRDLDEELWECCAENPVVFLEEISYDKLKRFARNQKYLENLKDVEKRFEEYMSCSTSDADPLIAYFSMEFGLHDSLKIFSGGLGILAGDYLKEASDTNTRMVGVGLLYRYGYFRQRLTVSGEQEAEYDYQQFAELPITPFKDENDEFITISVSLPGRQLKVRLWKVEVGRITLILLDTDLSDNSDEDRYITHQLYGGDSENRIKQEIVLGIGGIRALDILGINPDLYHCNEGHAAFIGLERLKRLKNMRKLSYGEALEIIRGSTLFTTHTPVPAGHDVFTEELMRVYLAHFAESLQISWEELMQLGNSGLFEESDLFSMSALAVNISQEVNGVSYLHGEVSKDMFQPMWPGYMKDESHIGYVTNGVHMRTWASSEWCRLLGEEPGDDACNGTGGKDIRGTVQAIDSGKIWNIRTELKKQFADYLKKTVEKQMGALRESPQKIMSITKTIDPEALTIGFARRFATYKRAHLLFRDLDRLAAIVNNPGYPVRFVFAGKAHPRDVEGQHLIKRIIDISKREEFQGKILFLENYDIRMAKQMVKGVDVWLNTPTRPLEASGTSGMKAIMNGALHFSVLDGWWVEGYREGGGWALPEQKSYENQEFQNELDAELIYSIIENEIVPSFYNRDEEGIPSDWINKIKISLGEIVPEFTTGRMLDDYKNRFYSSLWKRTSRIRENSYAMAKEIKDWKKRVRHNWNKIEVLRFDLPDTLHKQLTLGERHDIELELDLKNLSVDDVNVEMVFARTGRDGKLNSFKSIKMLKEQGEGTRAVFKLGMELRKAGSFNYGFRIYADNSLLPHRQDFSLVRWL